VAAGIEALLRLRGTDRGPLSLRSAKLVRHKPGRRALIEYRLEPRDAGSGAPLRVLGKIREKGLDRWTYDAMLALRQSGLTEAHPGHVAVPEPLGQLQEHHMWLQPWIPGPSVEQRLLELRPCPDSDQDQAQAQLGASVAEVAHALHESGTHPDRVHTPRRELQILLERLDTLARGRPAWGARLRRLSESCTRLAAELEPPRLRPIHRDLYADHIILGERARYLIDLDLHCMGDVAADLGNFIAHCEELGLRRLGRSDAFSPFQEALVARYEQLARASVRRSAHIYRDLSLVRLVEISTRIEEREGSAAALLELCESRMLGAASPRSRAAS